MNHLGINRKILETDEGKLTVTELSQVSIFRNHNIFYTENCVVITSLVRILFSGLGLLQQILFSKAQGAPHSIGHSGGGGGEPNSGRRSINLFTKHQYIMVTCCGSRVIFSHKTLGLESLKWRSIQSI